MAWAHVTGKLCGQGAALLLCAWVLWGKTSIDVFDGGQWRALPRDPWMPAGGFDSRESCVVESAVREKGAKEVMARIAPLAPYLPSRDDQLAFNPETSQWTTIFLCLPDTIDPRGPKQ